MKSLRLPKRNIFIIIFSILACESISYLSFVGQGIKGGNLVIGMGLVGMFAVIIGFIMIDVLGDNW